MIELITVTIICVLLLLCLRPGKTPPLANQLTIERPGQHHIILEAQLNLAQPFIEDVARQLGTADSTGPVSATQYFEVSDKNVTAHGHDSYLLAITRRNGILYFQAARPQSKDPSNQYKIISKFAGSVLNRFPTAGEHNAALDEHIAAAAQETAQLRSINIKQLFDPKNGGN